MIKLYLRKRGAENLTINILFAIFIVIFIVFVVFTMIQNRGTSSIVKAQSEYYTIAKDFLIAMVGNPCFSVGDYKKEGWQITTEAFLSQEKLDYYDRGNEDLDCVENYDFLYSLVVVDTQNKKTWRIGLVEEPVYAQKKLTVAIPVSIKYNTKIPEVHPGYAVLNAYIGSVPAFYGTIKQVCRTHDTIKTQITTNYKIHYNNTNNILYVGKQFFYPRMGCRVKSFNIEKGTYFLIIKYDEKSNSVIIVK